jgi:hypothetical protein
MMQQFITPIGFDPIKQLISHLLYLILLKRKRERESLVRERQEVTPKFGRYLERIFIPQIQGVTIGYTIYGVKFKIEDEIRDVIV